MLNRNKVTDCKGFKVITGEKKNDKCDGDCDNCRDIPSSDDLGKIEELTNLVNSIIKEAAAGNIPELKDLFGKQEPDIKAAFDEALGDKAAESLARKSKNSSFIKFIEGLVDLSIEELEKKSFIVGVNTGSLSVVSNIPDYVMDKNWVISKKATAIILTDIKGIRDLTPFEKYFVTQNINYELTKLTAKFAVEAGLNI